MYFTAGLGVSIHVYTENEKDFGIERQEQLHAGIKVKRIKWQSGKLKQAWMNAFSWIHFKRLTESVSQVNIWHIMRNFVVAFLSPRVKFGELTKYEEVSVIENWLDVQRIQNVHWQNQASQISVDSGLLSKWKVWPSDKHAVPMGSIPKNANLFGNFFPHGDPTPPFREFWSECKVIFWLFWKFEGDFRVTKF